MRENEFEKQVQEKMKEFNLSPKPEVWTEVQKHIRKEKKRRFIFWWPLLFLLAGGGITLGILLKGKKQKTGRIAAGLNQEHQPQSSVKRLSEPNTSPDKTTIDLQFDPEKTKGETILNGNNHNKILTTAPAGLPDLRLNHSNGKEKTEKIKAEIINTADAKIDKETTERQEKHQDILPALPLSAPAKPVDDLPDSSGAGTISVRQNNELLQQMKEPAPQINDSLNEHRKTKPAVNKSKQGSWGIALFAGGSATVQGLHLFDNKVNSNSSSLSLGAPPGADRNSSTMPKASASFGAGLFYKKPLSEKLDLNGGLSYYYLSTKIPAGSRVDSARVINNNNSTGVPVNYFYRAGSNIFYINRYHFIGISGDISWKIINGKKLKIYWDNGLSYSRLMASGMLHYDGSIPGYYKDNNLLNKNQWVFSTGFSLPVGKRMIVNPFASYSLATVLKNPGSPRNHYFSYGLRLRILLKNK